MATYAETKTFEFIDIFDDYTPMPKSPEFDELSKRVGDLVEGIILDVASQGELPQDVYANKLAVLKDEITTQVNALITATKAV